MREVKFTLKKLLSLLLSLIIIMALGIVCIKPVTAQYQGNISINADGSITPSTALIQHDDDIYTLTGDVIGSISILRSNVTFNGNNHSLVGLGLNMG